MTRPLRLGAVDELRVRLVFSRVLEGPAHDVFALDVRPGGSGASGAPTGGASGPPFDEAPVLDLLSPVLQAGGPEAYVVRVNRTQFGWAGGVDTAEIVVALATGLATSMDASATELVRSALRGVLRHVGTSPERSPGHDQALDEARLRVEAAFPDVHADRLVLTDEEHVADGGWSVGMSFAGSARFWVVLGFVDGDPRTTHVRRMPGSEIVDSVGAV